MRTLLTHIRSSGDQTKLHWLLGLSAVATVVVVALWLIYMLQTNSGAVVAATPMIPGQQTEDSMTILGRIGRDISSGIDGVKERTASVFDMAKNLFSSSNTVELTPETN